jgi:uncharacterized lipoprotein YmbA
MKIALAMVVALLLSGCVTDYICPPLAQYTPEQQAQVAAEIRAASRAEQWPTLMADYLKHRNACRAIGLGAS